MRRFLSALTIAAALPLVAQDAATTAPRVGFFNLRQLVETSVKAKKIYTELEVTGKNLQSKIEQKQAEGQKIQAQLQSGSLSDAGKEQLQKQLRDIDFEFKKLQEDSQAEFQKVNQKVMAELNRAVFPIIDALSKEQKLTMVFNGEQAATLLTWADTDWMKSFTAEVAKRLDAAPDAAAATTTSAAPQAAPKPVAKPAGKK